MTITLLGCLLGACAVAALYIVCFWQALIWSDVFGLRKDVGAGAPAANAAERPA